MKKTKFDMAIVLHPQSKMTWLKFFSPSSFPGIRFDLFDFYCSGYAAQGGGNSRLWNLVEPTLAPHLRQYARNLSLLQKSKDPEYAHWVDRIETALLSLRLMWTLGILPTFDDLN